MGILSRLFGYRWSLYIVRDQKQLVYVMHENNPRRLIGYVMKSFANGARPVSPWSLHLNFNRKNVSFVLTPEHFTADGEKTTELFDKQLEAIDPGWRVPGAEPVFLEAATKKVLRISSAPPALDAESMRLGMERRFAQMKSGEAPETTFFGVLREVFGKR